MIEKSGETKQSACESKEVVPWSFLVCAIFGDIPKRKLGQQTGAE